MDPALAMVFWPPNAPTLFSIAVDSAKRIADASRVGGQKDALVSVVFAAASLEAFLNESAYLADKSLQRKARELRLGHSMIAEPPIVSVFAQVMKEAGESRAQIQWKFQLAHLVLTQKAYDKGSTPYQDFSDLMAVRNLLMHGKSNEGPSKVNPPCLIRLALLKDWPQRIFSTNPYQAMRGAWWLSSVILGWQTWSHGRDRQDSTEAPGKRLNGEVDFRDWN
jgi:hypothetical protein